MKTGLTLFNLKYLKPNKYKASIAFFCFEKWKIKVIQKLLNFSLIIVFSTLRSTNVCEISEWRKRVVHYYKIINKDKITKLEQNNSTII